ncbi:MAG TPA: wax ester/triacylglycerol synthase domain-containing protein [Agromyces mariniharenae]|nr:wax ester/triacylglycerol synthase domain-containing protein [Agromyces mariniharenae]
MERISPIDAATLALSVHGEQPYLITLAGVLGAGGFVDRAGRPVVGRLRATLARRIAAIPVLTHRPVRRGADWWWEPHAPDLAAHVRVIDPESAARGLEAVCADLLMQPLPVDRPLWEIVLVPGLGRRRCGLVMRFHHVIADGIHAVGLVEQVFDPPRRAAASAAAAFAAPASASSSSPGAPTRRAATVTVSWAMLAWYRLRMFLRPWIRSRVLLGPLGPHRDVAGTSIDLEALRRGAHAAGGTVGDAYLAAVGRGLRRVLAAGGEDAPRRITVSAPVGLATREGQRNSVGVMLVDVPLRTSLEATVAAVAGRTRRAKPIARIAGIMIRSPRAARGFDAFARRQRLIAAVASNVPGPRRRLSLDRAPLIELLPLSPLAGNVRIGVTAASYDGRLWVGVVTAAGPIAPAAEVASAIGRALDELAHRGG